MSVRITAAQRKAKAQKTQKLIAYTALGAGVLASLSANYLAAHGGAVSRVVAVWPALALLITVHLFQHAPRNWMVKLAIFLVAGVAAWMSYWRSSARAKGRSRRTSSRPAWTA
jgi:membrane protein implicated in regulation of membrane protease activity